MQTWTQHVTTETLDAEARKTLDHIFSDDKTTLELHRCYVDFGHLEVDFLVPWTDGVGQFTLCMVSRKPVHWLRYRVPPMGPFAVVAQPLADAMAAELVVAYFRNMYKIHALRNHGEYEATFLPVIRLAVKLGTASKMSNARTAVCKARILHEAALACSYTSGTEEQCHRLIRLAVQARKEMCLSCLAFAVHVGVKLMRWKSKSLERMYRPHEIGFQLALASYASNAK